MDPAYGGPGQGIRNSIPELEKLGLHNEVVSLDDPAATFLGKDSFPIHAIGPAKGPWSYGEKLMPWLLDNLSRFDLVIVHGLWSYHGYAALKALNQLKRSEIMSKAKRKTPKLFVMPHGMLDPYFQKAPDRRLKALRNWIYWKVIESRLINEADGILFTCEVELLLARLPFSPYSPAREINVGYGIQVPPPYTQDMRNSFLEKCPQVSNSSYILFLSRIHEKKGVDLLIEAYVDFVKKRNTSPQSPDQRSHLVIAGPGLDTSYGQRLLQLVHQTDVIKGLVHFPGMLSGDAKWGAFYGSEAFILPSHQENFGIAVAEALACGVPTLISNQVNIWREIQDGGAGIVSDNTLAGTKQLLVQWDNLTPSEKDQMRKSSIQVFNKYFAIGPAAQRLAEAISQ